MDCLARGCVGTIVDRHSLAAAGSKRRLECALFLRILGHHRPNLILRQASAAERPVVLPPAQQGHRMISLGSERIQLAQHHVRRGREIVARQRELIAGLRAQSLDIVDAEDLLKMFEKSLVIFEEDLKSLLNRQ